MRRDSHPDVYDLILVDVSTVIEAARRSAARSVNCIMTAAYWHIGRRIVESEQRGEKRAAYGEELLERLSADLGKRYGRGFGVDNLQRFRVFYLTYPPNRIYATLSRKSDLDQPVENYATPSRNSQADSSDDAGKAIRQTVSGICAAGLEMQAASAELPSGVSDVPNMPIFQTVSGISAVGSREQTAWAKSDLIALAACFPLPWSAYVRLLGVKNELARKFYEAEALRGGWSVRQLDRQIDCQFYERTALSRNKAAMLRKGQKGAARRPYSARGGNQGSLCARIPRP